MSAAQPEAGPKVNIYTDDTAHVRELHEGVQAALKDEAKTLQEDVFKLPENKPEATVPPSEQPVGPESLRDLLKLPNHQISFYDVVPKEYVPEALIKPEDREGSSSSKNYLDILLDRDSQRDDQEGGKKT